MWIVEEEKGNLIFDDRIIITDAIQGVLTIYKEVRGGFCI